MEKCWVYGDTVDGRKILLVDMVNIPSSHFQCFIGIPIVTLPGAVQKPSIHGIILDIYILYLVTHPHLISKIKPH
jgi:hypothetical protein